MSGAFGLEQDVQGLVRVEQTHLADTQFEQTGGLGPVGISDPVEHIQAHPRVAAYGSDDGGGLDASESPGARDDHAFDIFYNIPAA